MAVRPIKCPELSVANPFHPLELNEGERYTFQNLGSLERKIRYALGEFLNIPNNYRLLMRDPEEDTNRLLLSSQARFIASLNHIQTQHTVECSDPKIRKMLRHLYRHAASIYQNDTGRLSLNDQAMSSLSAYLKNNKQERRVE